MKKFRRRFIAALLAGLMLFALCACGGSGKNDEPVYFRLAFTEAAETYNALSGYDTLAMSAFAVVYDPLFRLDENYEAAPCLAAEYQFDEDSLTYTLKLREGVKWHDGEDFTAEDVAYALDVTSRLSYGYSYYISNIDPESVAVLDDHTVSFALYEYASNTLEYLTYVPILPKHIWDGYTDEEIYNVAADASTFIGTGPYKYYSDDDGSLTMLRNDGYFGENNSDIDALVFVYNIGSDSAKAALDSGEVDGVWSMNTSALESMASDAKYTAIAGMVNGFTGIGFNLHSEEDGSTGNPLLLVKEIRQAIDYCVEKQYIIDMAYNGMGVAGSSMLSPNNGYFRDLTADPVYRDSGAADNIDRAVALLEGQGFVYNASGGEYGASDRESRAVRYNAEGVPLSFELCVESDNVEDCDAALLISAACAEAGIGLAVAYYDQSTLWDIVDEYQFDMYIVEWGGDVDPSFVASLFAWDDGYFSYQAAGYNDSGYSNDDYDALYYEQLYSRDESERRQILDEMQRIVFDDCPYIVMGYISYIQAVNSSRWEGMRQVPNDSGLWFDITISYNWLNLKLKS